MDRASFISIHEKVIQARDHQLPPNLGLLLTRYPLTDNTDGVV